MDSPGTRACPVGTGSCLPSWFPRAGLAAVLVVFLGLTLPRTAPEMLGTDPYGYAQMTRSIVSQGWFSPYLYDPLLERLARSPEDYRRLEGFLVPDTFYRSAGPGNRLVCKYPAGFAWMLYPFAALGGMEALPWALPCYSLLLLVVVYRVLRRRFSGEVGFLGAAFVAFSPYTLNYTTHLFAEQALSLVFWLALACLWLRTPSPGMALLAGMLGGFLPFLKFSAFILWLPLGVAAWGSLARERRGILAAFLLGMVLGFAPLGYYLLVTYGTLFTSTYTSVHPGAWALPHLRTNAWPYVKHFLLLTGKKGFPVHLLILAGLARMFRYRAQEAAWLCGTVALVFLFFASSSVEASAAPGVFYYDPRYLLPLLPLLGCLFAVGAEALLACLSPRIRPAAGILGLAWLCFLAAPMRWPEPHEVPGHRLAAALRDLPGAPPPVLLSTSSRAHGVRLYLGRACYRLDSGPAEDWLPALGRLREWGHVGYAVLGETDGEYRRLLEAKFTLVRWGSYDEGKTVPRPVGIFRLEDVGN